jgi:hypothetical protein
MKQTITIIVPNTPDMRENLDHISETIDQEIEFHDCRKPGDPPARGRSVRGKSYLVLQQLIDQALKDSYQP